VVEDHSTHGSFLNGQRIEGKADLVTGDRLRLGSPGIEVVLLRVEGDGSSTG
jgi:pSer/pThr/pTyr-binding forkhead associated (FHA) protein